MANTFNNDRGFKVQEAVEKRRNMLRQAQHERILLNYFKTVSVRPEHCRRIPNGFFNILLSIATPFRH